MTRFQVNDDDLSWEDDLEGYSPTEFTDPSVLAAPAADPHIPQSEEAEGEEEDWKKPTLAFNSLDGKINRKSFTGKYSVLNGRPLNPVGRTGVTGRGLLWRWGPNHAADPIVTRWKKDERGNVCKFGRKPVLQFAGIQRKDTGEWAIPGGMVDPGEVVTTSLLREFLEEATNALERDDESTNQELVREFFEDKAMKVEVYKGYVDDPRNTDNAWMETVAINFHDGKGKYLDKFSLEAGDDAASVSWIDLDKPLDLYASHVTLIQRVCEMRSAYWPYSS